MKKSIILFTFFCFYSSLSLGQITFSEVLSLENKSYKQAKAFLIANHSIIKDSKDYYYYVLNECNPPKYHEDGCEWACASVDHSDNINSKVKISNPVFKDQLNKNYGVWLTLESSFAENYDPITKKATTFISTFKRISQENNNCENILREDGYQSRALTFDIQFSDRYQWKEFKRSITQKASFLKTKSGIEKDEIIICYVIERKVVNGLSRGVYIELVERGSTFHAKINTDSGYRE